MKPPLIIDNFAGGGGASTGIERALGRPVDVTINHDAEAVAMHLANHPTTKHYCQSIMAVDQLEATGGAPVALAWFSPDCKHHSKAKGGSAQGFPADYVLDPIGPEGRPLSIGSSIQMIGNNVCPDVAGAFANANLPLEWFMQVAA